MKVVWDEDAADDLDAIERYIAADNPRAAARVLTEIRRAAMLLQAMPNMGRPSVDPGVRERVLTRYPYTLIYEVSGNEVHILGVVHQSRDKP